MVSACPALFFRAMETLRNSCLQANGWPRVTSDFPAQPLTNDQFTWYLLGMFLTKCGGDSLVFCDFAVVEPHAAIH